MKLKLMYITNKSSVALIAEKYGVDRIWVDLEKLGKSERQKNMNTVKSNHTIRDIEIIKPLLTTSELLVRVNPWNKKSEEEIEAVIDAGADIIMMPMWKSVSEVRLFINTVRARVKTVLLLETKEAVECVDEALCVSGIDEIYIGLNDLHLSYGMTFMFELLADGTVERLCKKFNSIGIPFGFGGLAKIGNGILPAEKIIMEHYRLGSTRAILSRTFCDSALLNNIEELDKTFERNMRALRKFEEYAACASENAFLLNKEEVADCIDKIVSKMKERKNVKIKFNPT